MIAACWFISDGMKGQSFMKIRGLIVFLFLAAASIRATYGSASAQDNGLGSILDRVAEKLDSYPKTENWKASVVSVITEMDKNWKPKKITRVRRTVRVTDKERSQEILEALETEKGVTKNITEKYKKEAEERQKKAKEAAEERERQKTGEGNENRIELSGGDLLPFSKENRTKYEFTRLEDAEVDSQIVYVLESRAKTSDEKLWEGKYFISRASFDVLKLNLKPAKYPKFVKVLETEVSFQVLPDGQLVVRKSKFTVDGGMFIKHVRMVTEEEYSEFEIPLKPS